MTLTRAYLFGLNKGENVGNFKISGADKLEDYGIRWKEN